MNKAQKVIKFLGLKRSIAALLGMVVLVGLGERMAERFLPIYLVALGGGTLAIGLLNGMQNLLGALYSYPGGYASDRFGYKRALMLFNLVAILGYAIVVIFPCWQAVIIGAIFFLSWSAVSLPATMDMVAAVLPAAKRTMGVSLHSLVRRVPMALGPVLGGVMIMCFGEKDGVRMAFGAAILLALVSLVFQQTLIEDGARQDKKPTGNPLRIFRQMSPDLKNLLVSDIMIRFCEQIPYAFVVVWCMKLNSITAVQFGTLTAIEMVTAMLVYIPVAYLADRSVKKPFVVATFVFFSLFPLALLVSHSFLMMALAFVVRGMKEFGEPTRKALILDLAPEAGKAGAFGVYYLVRDTVVSIAAFGGAFLWDASIAEKIAGTLGWGYGALPWVRSVASPETNLVTAFVFGIAGTLYFAIFGKDPGKGSGKQAAKQASGVRNQ